MIRASSKSKGKRPAVSTTNDRAIDTTSTADPRGDPGSPRLPHERDESVGATDGVPSKKMVDAHRDLQRGVEDTSRAPEADRAYRKLKR
ncbi:MAG: hypothetical protein ABI702_19540 [Burkholderiales bacterium]